MRVTAFEYTASNSTHSIASSGGSGSITRETKKCLFLAIGCTAVHLVSNSFLGCKGVIWRGSLPDVLVAHTTWVPWSFSSDGSNRPEKARITAHRSMPTAGLPERSMPSCRFNILTPVGEIRKRAKLRQAIDAATLPVSVEILRAFAHNAHLLIEI